MGLPGSSCRMEVVNAPTPGHGLQVGRVFLTWSRNEARQEKMVVMLHTGSCFCSALQPCLELLVSTEPAPSSRHPPPAAKQAGSICGKHPLGRMKADTLNSQCSPLIENYKSKPEFSTTITELLPVFFIATNQDEIKHI